MRSHRLALAVVAAGVCCVPLSPAGAAPFAGQYRGVDVSFSVVGADSATYNIELTATQNVAGTQKEQSLYLHLERCYRHHCRQLPASAKALPDGSVSISPGMTSATVSSTLGTVTVAVHATASYVDVGTQSVSNPGVQLLSLNGPGVRVVSDMAALGAVSLGRVSCPVTADIFTYQAVDTVGTGTGSSHAVIPKVPAGLSHGRARPRCAS